MGTRSCGKVVESCNLATSLSPPCHNHAITSQATVTCHNLVLFLPPHSNLGTTLQACDKVTHVHLMIFILTKTQRKSIEVHATSVRIFTFTGKSPYFRLQKDNVSWEFTKTPFVLEE